MSYISDELTNVQTYGVLKDEFPMDRWDVTFYCRDCEKQVETERVGDDRKMKFTCKECEWKRVAYGTKEGVKEFYNRS